MSFLNNINDECYVSYAVVASGKEEPQSFGVWSSSSSEESVDVVEYIPSSTINFRKVRAPKILKKKPLKVFGPYETTKSHIKNFLRAFPCLKECPPSLREEWLELVALKRKIYYQHRQYLEMQRDRALHHHYLETLESPISNYEHKPARPTSTKQVKVKPVILDNNCWTDEELERGDNRQSPSFKKFEQKIKHREFMQRVPRQCRLGLFLDSLPAKASSLVEGILRAKALILDRLFPGTLDRLKEVFNKEVEGIEEGVEAQMETAHGDVNNTEVSSKGNVSLMDQQKVSKTETRLPRTIGFLPQSSASELQTFSQITSRWLRYSKSIAWKSADAQGDNLLTLKLPFDILEDNKNSPNVMPFKIHKYGRMDMRVKVLVNSNKFQVGQLQCSWMYNSHINIEKSKYDNIWLASQRRFAIVNAGSSNSCEIDIPYWNVYSAMNMKQNIDEKGIGQVALSMGELSIKVLSQLSVPDGGYNSAHVSILVCFDHPEFRALCDADNNRVIPNMEEVVNTMENVLHFVKPILNADKPSKPELPLVVQPKISHPFSGITNQNEIITPLRSDPLAVTPPLVAFDGEDCSLRSLLSRWSLLTSFKWSNKDDLGAKLLALDSSPVMNKTTYKYSVYNDSKDKFYYLPIIAVLSQLFAYWRGDIELRFDFVATQYHSGRLMVATIPGAHGEESIDIAKNSANVIFSLTDNHQLIYRVPFYSNIPWWDVKHNLSKDRDIYPPSKTIIYVVNPLIPMPQVVSAIEVLVYVRAADNFELSLLKSPSIGLSLHTRVMHPARDIAYVDPQWAQMFTAGSRQFDWKEGEALSFFYNQTTDFFTEFTNLYFDQVYTVPSTGQFITIDTETVEFRVQYYKAEGVLEDVKFLVRAYQYAAYPVVVLFDTEIKARQYLETKNLMYALQKIKQGPWAQWRKSENLPWSDIPDDKLIKVPFTRVARIDDEFEVVQAQMEEQSGSVSQAIALDKPASRVGLLSFGEQILDVKSICRRWQLLGCDSISVPSNYKCLSQAGSMVRISTHPLKYFNVFKSSDRHNRLRDGLISIISSGFAGYRGSMRYRVVVNGTQMSTLTFSVVHKFDKRGNVGSPSVVADVRKNIKAGDWMDTAYAAEIQSTVVNNVIEFEIPFYNKGEYNSLYRSSSWYISENFQTSGEIYLYVSGVKVGTTLGFDVYYSIGDDFTFSNFQGFPSCMFLDDIAPEPQMDYIKSFFTVPKQLGDMCDVVKSACGTLASGVCSSVSSVADSFKGICEAPFVSKGLDSLSSLASACTGVASLIISQILHIVSHPFSKATLAISIFSVLALMFKDNILSGLSYIKDLISASWDWFFGKNKQNESDDKVQAQGEEDPLEMPSKFMSLLWSVAALVIGFKSGSMFNEFKGDESILSKVKRMFKASSESFRMHIFGVKFFRDFMDLIKTCWNWINKKLGRTKPLYLLTSNDKFLKEWAISSSIILAPENKSKVLQSKEWVGKLYELQVIGRMIKQAAIDSEDHIKRDLYNLILTNQRELTALVDETIKRKNFVPIRQEPFIVWLVGEPGVGKTHMAQEIMRKLALDYKLDPNIFSLVAGQKYYDLLNDQKFVLLDDFLNWSGNDVGDVYSQYLQMAGTNLLSLPRSVASEKAVMDNFEFLFVTSNEMWFNNHCGIREPAAYNRRRHMTIYLRPSEEFSRSYMSEKAAASAYRKLSIKQKENYKALVFDIYDKDSGEKALTITSYDELLKHVRVIADRARADASKNYFDAVTQHNLCLDKASKCDSFKDFFNQVKKIDDSLTYKELPKLSQEDLKSSLEWLSARLKERYGLFDVLKPSEKTELLDKVKQAHAKNEELQQKDINRIEVVADVEPQGPIIEEVVDEPNINNLDSFVESVLIEETKENEEQKKMLDRFVSPYKDIYSRLDLPELAIDGELDFLRWPFQFKKQTVCPYGDLVPECPHANFSYATSRYYRFSDAYRNEIRKIVGKEFKFIPEGMFVDMRGINNNFRDYLVNIYAVYDVPCQHRTGVDPHCCYHRTERRFEFEQYWNSLLTLLQRHEILWLDLMKVDEKHLTSFMPSEFVGKMKSIYKRDTENLKALESSKLKNILRVVSFGFLANRMGIDGIDHGIYPTFSELDDSRRRRDKVEVARTKNILFTQISYSDGSSKEEPGITLKILVSLALIIAAMSVLCMFIEAIQWFIDCYGLLNMWGTAAVVANISTSGDFKTTKQASTATVKAMQLLSPVSPNGVEEVFQPYDGKKEKIIKNTFFIIALKNTGENQMKKLTARCLGLYGRTGIVLTHYIEHFQHLLSLNEGWELKLYRTDSKTLQPFSFENCKINYPETGGYSLISLPSGAVHFRDIRRYIPREGACNYPSKAVLVEVFGDKVIETQLDIKLSFKTRVAQGGENGIKDWTIDQMFEYSKGGKGLCGSFLYADCDRPLIGIHTAGIQERLGLSELLLFETFKDDCTVPLEMVSPNLEIDPDKYQPQGPHVAVGHLDNSMSVMIPRTTRIIPSLAHGLFETHTEPAPLHPNDPRLPPNSSPLELGVEKRCDPLLPFNSKDLDKSIEDVENMILSQCKPIRACTNKLTVSQAIEGIPGIVGMEPLELKTSEGFPWTRMRTGANRDKRWLIEMDYSNGVKCKGINPQLKDILDLKDQLRKRGKVPATYFTACLKDARIAKAKVGIPGKTRLFEMSPIDMSIAQRQHFLDFYASYMANRRSLEHTVGINVNGREWSMLATDLISHSPCIVAGDYSSYGPRMSMEILHRVWDIKIKWMFEHSMDKETSISQEALKYECLNSLLVVNNYVMRAISGMHSGNVATVILNSMCNSVLIRLAYLHISRIKCSSVNSLYYFNKYVKMFSNGDDLIAAVSPEIVEWFNNETISKFFSIYGLKYTNSKKDKDVIPYESIFEVSYLKCLFVPHPLRRGEWLAALDRSSIEDTCQWIWNRDIDSKEATKQNCEQSVRLAYGNGEKYFNKIRTTCLDFLTRIGERVIYPTWEELDRNVWDDGLMIVNF